MLVVLFFNRTFLLNHISCPWNNLLLNRRKEVNRVPESNLKPYPLWKKYPKEIFLKVLLFRKFLKGMSKKAKTQILSYRTQMLSKRENLGIPEQQRSEVWDFLICISWLCYMGYSLPECKLPCSSPPTLGSTRPRSALSLWVCLPGTEEAYSSVAKPQDRMQPLPPLTHKMTGPAHFPFWRFCSFVYSGALAILSTFLHSTEINKYICECALRQGSKEISSCSLQAKHRITFPPITVAPKIPMGYFIRDK